MKRSILTASAMLAFVVPAVAQARFIEVTYQPHKTYTKIDKTYLNLYKRVAKKFGVRTPGRNIVEYGLATGRAATFRDINLSITRFRNWLIPPPVPVHISTTASVTIQPAYVTPSSSGGGYANVPGVPASFAACVALRESTNGAGSSNIYGILGSGGQGSLAEQKAAFAQMYAQRGTQPWAPYDGCS